MDEQNSGGGIELPKELEKALIKAIQEVCFYLHEQTHASHIILDIKHISDAIAQCSSTLISGAGLGLRLESKDKAASQQPSQEEDDASKMAQEAIDRAIAAAKAQGSAKPREKNSGEQPQK